jgi:hypothetical protein
MQTEEDEMNSQMRASRRVISRAMNTIHTTQAQRVITGAIKDEARNTTTQSEMERFTVFSSQNLLTKKIITIINSSWNNYNHNIKNYTRHHTTITTHRTILYMHTH